MPYTHGKSIIKIAIADKDLTYQEFFPGIIDRMEKCKVIIQVYDCKQLLEKLKENSGTNLIVMDFVFPGEDAFDTVQIIKTEFPEIKIMFTSYFENKVVYCMVIDAGANGFIAKGTGAAELKKGINEVMKTGHYFPNIPVEINHKHLNRNGKKHKNKFTLTREEIIFLKLSCTELTYDAIASAMKSTTRHTEYNRLKLFEKFEVHSQPELATIAKNSGFGA